MSSSVSLEYLNSITPSNTYALCAQNQAGTSIAVILLGTAIPLATIGYNNGFTANAANTQFTVENTGVYRISYKVNVTASALLSTSVYKNGTAIAALDQVAAISLTNFGCEAIVSLNQGDVLQLTFYGLLGTAILASGVGAVMTVVRIN
ncbi:MAG: hypothetical protein FWF81_14720 [Defluviitaleaceae bacterium]|nr:hypothetical protein [Defluviitaleaceae bacterium]